MLILPFVVAACGGGHTETKPTGPPAVEAAVASVAAADLPLVYEAGGVVRARTTAAITSRLLAPVMEVRVAAGDRVRAGQVLVRLDDRNLAAEQRRASSGREIAEQAGRGARSDRRAAEAELALAAVHHKRVLMLHERKSATDDELDQAVAALRAAESRLAGADARIAEAGAGLSAATAGADAAMIGASWAVVTAPFDGVITEKLVEPGNMAAPGMPLLRVEQTGPLRLDVRLDESRAGAFRTGQEVEVRLDAGVVQASAGGAIAGPVMGRVTEIARAAEAGAHAFLVKIELPADLPVTSGSFARARFSGPPRRVLAVPQAAIVRRGQLASVFVVDGEHARLRLVSVGDAVFSSGSTDLVEVLAGLDEGERVVVHPSAAVRDGVRLRGGGTASASPARSAGAS